MSDDKMLVRVVVTQTKRMTMSFVKVLCTQAQYAAEKHLDAADEVAARAGIPHPRVLIDDGILIEEPGRKDLAKIFRHPKWRRAPLVSCNPDTQDIPKGE